MGIADNIFFVVNCDFAEHNSLDNLISLVESVIEDARMLVPEPRAYAFSALFNLFKQSPGALNKKDALRLEQWRGETAFVEYAQKENRKV